MQAPESTLESVRSYYGRVLKSSGDLKTTACCPTEPLPSYLKQVLSEIDEEIQRRFYGCGSPIPLALEDCTVLDLGCGTGRDAYLASRLVGRRGNVVGVDMTEEQLELARRHVAAHMLRFGYEEPNVDFRSGYIEDLRSAGVEDESVDVVISNCVINLSPDKPRVFEEIFRVLKPGGELYFSDVFADRRLQPEVAMDPVLYGECLGGAMYEEDFRRLLRDVGCLDYRVTSSCSIELQSADLERLVGNARFTSKTIRTFKLPGLLEDLCEDYGQVAYYKGTIEQSPHRFELDDHHLFEAGRPVLVCGNTAAMLQQTRYAWHFDVVGDRSVHYGPFDCVPSRPADAGASSCGC